MKIDSELQNAIMHACQSDASKIIDYLESEKRKSRLKNVILFISSVIAAVASVVALILQFI